DEKVRGRHVITEGASTDADGSQMRVCLQRYGIQLLRTDPLQWLITIVFGGNEITDLQFLDQAITLRRQNHRARREADDVVDLAWRNNKIATTRILCVCDAVEQRVRDTARY